MATMGSLFSGVGGFELGFERAGVVTRWQCEIDNDATDVLARHWPDVRRYRDVRHIDPADLEPVDVIAFGSPCQGFSVAGKRGGLDDERSGLFGEAIRIIGGVRPILAVWENVVGSFSTDDGNDFRAVIRAFADLGALDIGWRVLDSLGVGDCDLHRDDSGRWPVPQRRRRVFVVADFGGRRAAEILSLGDGVRRHPETRRKKREAAAARAGRGAAPGGGEFVGTLSPGAHPGGYNGQDAYSGLLIAQPVAAFGGNNRSGPVDAAATLTAHGGSHSRLDFESETFVVENALYFEPRVARNGRGAPETVASALKAEAGTTGKGDAADNLIVEAQAFDWQSSGGNDTSFRGGARSYPVRAGDYAGSLGASKHDAVAIGWQESQSGTRERGDFYGTLDANYGPRRHEGVLVNDGLRYVVRRLTPLECERLMCWPDSWTRYRADGREIADGPRYRMCGNGVAANVAEWIARRMRAALEAV